MNSTTQTSGNRVRCNNPKSKAKEQFCTFQASRFTLATIKAPAVLNWSQHSQQIFRGVERKSRQSPDQRAVEADILQVAPDVDFDQRNQLRHVPGLHLIGNEGR